MTSFELFRLLKFNKNLYFIYFFHIFFLLKWLKCDKLHHYMKNIIYFASNYGIRTAIKIKLSNLKCRKENVGGA